MNNSHRIALIAALLMLVAASPAAAQRWQWAQHGRGADHDAASRVHVDSVGNSYVLGRFAGSIAFGASLMNGIGLWDLFVAKFNPAGTLQWATSITSAGTDLPGDIVTDRQGNIYVSGTFAGQAIINGAVAYSAGSSDMFVTKMNPDGVVQWTKTGGGTGPDFGTGIDIDEPGAFVYVSGTFTGAASFSGDALTSAGGSDVFIARYSTSQGGIQWARSAGGPRDDESVGIGVDRFGNAFIAGFYTDSASFGPVAALRIALAGSDSGAAFVARYDFAGVPRWVKSVGLLNRYRAPLSLAVDIEGNSYLAGSFTDTVVIGTDTLISRGKSDAFLARYNAFGGYRWALQEGDTANDFGLGVGVDNASNSFLTGALDNEPGVRLDTAVRERLFVARYDPNAVRTWMVTTDRGRIRRGLDVGVDRLGNHVVGGQFSDSLSLDNIRMYASGGLSDAFVARLGPDATIATSALQDRQLCAGSTVNVAYTTGGTFFADNNFIAQLSDSLGSFATPVRIGSRLGAGPSIIVAKIPEGMPEGLRYRIRVIGTSPIATGTDNGEDLEIVALPRPVITNNIDDTLCRGESVTLDAGPGYASYLWSTGARSQTITVSETGQYSVIVATSLGCEGQSDVARITVFPIPPQPVITQVGNTLRVTGGTTHQWYLNGVAIQGADRDRYTPTESGSYTVTVFNEAGCSATSAPFQFTSLAALEEIVGTRIVIDRRDAERIVVSSLAACAISARLVDVAGRTVAERSARSSLAFDVTELPAGAYLLVVRGCDGREVVRKVLR